MYKCTSGQRNFYCKGEAAWNSLPGELRNYASLNRKTNHKPFSLTSFNSPYTNTEIIIICVLILILVLFKLYFLGAGY